MKSLLLLCLYSFLFACQMPVAAQSSFRIIGICPQIEESLTADFYISGIKDHRDFKSNIGIVNRGVDRANKRPVLPKTGFWSDIEACMDHWLIPDSEADPVAMEIKELYLWENRQAQSAEGHVRLRLKFLPQGSEEGTSVSVTVSGPELLVSEGHAPRIEAAFFESLVKYQAIRSGDQAVKEASKAYAKPSAPRQLQAADNFLDLYKGELRPVYTSLKRRRNTKLDQFEMRRAKQPPFYALVDGDNWFLKANTYLSAGDHYTLVLEKGRYLFLIDEEPTKGWVHLRVERQSEDRRVGILIDMHTGVPQVVNDQLINELMAPYPDLKKQYLFKDILKYPFQLNRVRNVIAAINLREENS